MATFIGVVVSGLLGCQVLAGDGHRDGLDSATGARDSQDSGPARTCEEVPAELAPPAGWADSCTQDSDCAAGLICREGATGGFYGFYDYTCSLPCDTTADCPVVEGSAGCGGPDEYCNLISCVSGVCTEENCVE